MMIGIFDSGVGGLTVLRAIRAQFPTADLVYLGDTARLPYGTKSAQTVVSYAVQAAQFLQPLELHALVIACNTASAHALTAVQRAFPDLPVLGVIEPGAQVAARHSQVVVLATEGTVASGAYASAIHAKNPHCGVRSLAAGLLVALAEEGWTEGAEAEAIIRRYLAPVLPDLPEALVLGCTHFPLLTPALRQVVGEKVAIIDSAATTAAALAQQLDSVSGTGQTRLLVTDNPARFARVAQNFLGQRVAEKDVTLVDVALTRRLAEAVGA
jgi:glutamate racemase